METQHNNFVLEQLGQSILNLKEDIRNCADSDILDSLYDTLLNYIITYYNISNEISGANENVVLDF